MRDNRDLVQKADFLLAQLAPGGLLEPAQADRFIRLAIDRSAVLPLMTRVDMKAPKELREKIRYGSRALRAGAEAVALPVAQRAAPDTSKVELDAKLAKAETRVSFEALEDSIERGAFEQTVRDTLAERVSLDLEDVAINGDTTSADELLKLLNGFRVQTVTNTVNAGGATLSRTVLKDTLKTMPSEFRRDKRALRFMTADEAVIDYHESIADRMTPQGDEHVQAPMVGPFEGIPVVDVPVFPTNLGGGANQTDMLLTDPSNMLFGVWRNIRFDTDRDIQAGVYVIVVSLRVDFKFAHEPAVVKATAVRAV
jgi:HK97 family phage major capsid protein